MSENKFISLDDAALDEVSGGAFSIGGEIKIKLPTLTLPDLGDVAKAGKTIFGAVFSLLPKID